jgi:tetratricopeptide (TPR) repeat protein
MRHAPVVRSVLLCCAALLLRRDARRPASCPTPTRHAPASTEAESVDGLIVGHRLMASDEPELALRAYYRAAGELGLNADVLSALGLREPQARPYRTGRGASETGARRGRGFRPALNNLGVVLMERREYGEARRVFQQAFALDSGRTDAIRENLRLAIARMEDSVYDGDNNERQLDLIRRGPGVYELLSTAG